MRKIVAIGGGVLRDGETDAMDRFILDYSGAAKPRVLFVPTASSDSEEYVEAFNEVYGAKLGCDVDVLYLLGRDPSTDELAEKVLSADIVYVGGGNTLKMMRRWRRLGVDRLVAEVWDKGTVLCGVSPGAICWFSHGHSDSMSFYSDDDWKYVAVKGMGFVDALACPHYDSDTRGVPRREDFRRMVLKRGGPAVAIDNDCAIAFRDDSYQVVSARAGAGAFRLRRERGAIVEEPLPNNGEWSPISEILNSGG
ncbi:MAG: peptidase E [SAR202 cluster bacterium]|nr:peptidase E [SAR202 cluster bacterium]